ncbi:hypothetical protein ABBQ38_001746 [Trebouxia sp. C0009 RCD-2024]
MQTTSMLQRNICTQHRAFGQSPGKLSADCGSKRARCPARLTVNAVAKEQDTTRKTPVDYLRDAAKASVGAMLAATMTLTTPLAYAAPFDTGTGMAPTGNLRSSDGSAYKLDKLGIPATHVRAGIGARKDYTDKDIVDFLCNTECIEGRFDTMGVQGKDFKADLLGPNSKPSKGLRKANLSPRTKALLEEVALSEQGHALYTRQAGSTIPCPYVDYDKGFNAVFARAYGLKDGETIAKLFGSDWDPYVNDATFALSMVFLEELGATGNKGLALLHVNPVLADGTAGLATSATAFAAIERSILFDLKDEIVPPTNETVAQVFARLSAYRDSMDGPQLDDQGLLNKDPRFITVPDSFVNNIPTDIRGLTYSRTPLMNLNILMLGAKDGKGGFFPEGIAGRINTPEGFDNLASGLDDWEGKQEAKQMPASEAENDGPILPEGPPGNLIPKVVPGQNSLTQELIPQGPPVNENYKTRGY